MRNETSFKFFLYQKLKLYFRLSRTLLDKKKPFFYSYYPGYYSFDNGTPSPKVTTTSDLDLDLLLRYYGNNKNYNNFYYPTVLPEAAIKVSNYNSRKARLWRKVYYLEYLRELYRRYINFTLFEKNQWMLFVIYVNILRFLIYWWWSIVFQGIQRVLPRLLLRNIELNISKDSRQHFC